MSHSVTTKHALPITNLDLLQQIVARHGLPPLAYVQNIAIGFNDEKRRFTGWATKLPGWKFPVIFNLETGETHWNNWPVYEADHRDVKSGKRLVGEEGRWGDHREYYKLVDEYILATIAAQAACLGEVVTPISEHELLIEHHG